jgi:hypothetical protein
VSRADTHSTRARPRGVLAWSPVLASLFQAVAGSALGVALGGPATTTSVRGRVSPDAVAAGDDGQGRGPSCASLFGSYNWRLLSRVRQGPCGLGPDATTPISVQPPPATAALTDADDTRTRLLVGRPERATFLVSRSDP